MNKKLTPTQMNYLLSIAEGNSISFCTEVCNQLGKISYFPKPTFKTNRRAIFSLVREGYLNKKDISSYGIRWSLLTISPKGHALLGEQNA